MEVAIVGIHTVEITRIELPDFLRLNDMESAAVFLIEGLHLSDEEKAVKVIRKPLVPSGCPSVFTDLPNEIDFHNMVADLGKELFQDAFVDAREDVTHNQRFRLKFVKARRELQFVLHGAAQFVQVLIILAGTPFMDDAVTVRLVGLGHKTLQAFQNGGVHRLRKRGQQNVRCKVAQRLVLFLDVAGVLPRKLPEGFDAAKLADVLQDTVCLLIETRGKDGDDDILRGAFAQTGENHHNVDMELEGRLIVPPDPAQLLNTLFAVEELCIELDRLPHCGRRRDIQLVHLHGDKICAEWFAVIFNVLKPVVFVAGVCNRAVDEVIAL